MKYQMVRLPVDLLQALGEAGKSTSRTIPKEAEFRLRESLAKTGSVAVASPWARAVGEAMTRLASEIDEIGSGPEVRFGMLRKALDRFSSEMHFPDTQLNKDDAELVHILVRAFALKLRRAQGSVLLDGLDLE